MKAYLYIPVLAAISLGACAGGGAAQARRAAQDPASMLANADADRNGRITREEFARSRERLFERIDRNRDGYVSGADAPGRRRGGAGERLAEVRRSLDANGDGRVDRREFVDSPGLLFDRADANRDDVVDPAELESLRRSLAGRARG